jgi:hypothetical protein
MTGTRVISKRIAAGAGALVLALSASHCMGQASYTATGPGTYVNVGATFSGYESDYGKRLLGGESVYVDANLYRRWGVEAEARRFNVHLDPNGVQERTYLVGPKLSFLKHGYRPYAKLLVGRGEFTFPYNYAQGSYFVVAPGGGVDFRIKHSRLSLRMVDFEYQMWPQFTFGALHPYGVSAGFSYQVYSGSSRLR